MLWASKDSYYHNIRPLTRSVTAKALVWYSSRSRWPWGGVYVGVGILTKKEKGMNVSNVLRISLKEKWRVTIKILCGFKRYEDFHIRSVKSCSYRTDRYIELVLSKVWAYYQSRNESMGPIALKHCGQISHTQLTDVECDTPTPYLWGGLTLYLALVLSPCIAFPNRRQIWAGTMGSKSPTARMKPKVREMK